MTAMRLPRLPRAHPTRLPRVVLRLTRLTRPLPPVVRAALALVVALVAAGAPGLVRADHYIYSAQRPPVGFDYIDTFAMRKWFNHTTVRYAFDTTYVPGAYLIMFVVNADQAVLSWKNTAGLTELQWGTTSGGGTPDGTEDVLFQWPENGAEFEFRCGSVTSVVACHVMDTNTDSVREARYGLRATIYPNPVTAWNASFLWQTMAHEIGHVYGLADRYRHGPPPSHAGEDSVMDYNPQTGPRPLDVDRAKWFWRGGAGAPAMADPVAARLDNLAMSYAVPDPQYPNTFDLTSHWDDYAWAEYDHVIGYFLWNPFYQQWLAYPVEYVADRVGGHKLMGSPSGSSRRLSTTWTMTGGSGTSTWRFCGRPRFTAHSGLPPAQPELGTERCSADFVVPSA